MRSGSAAVGSGEGSSALSFRQAQGLEVQAFALTLLLEPRTARGGGRASRSLAPLYALAGLTSPSNRHPLACAASATVKQRESDDCCTRPLYTTAAVARKHSIYRTRHQTEVSGAVVCTRLQSLARCGFA
jgi:hypothetical protein